MKLHNDISGRGNALHHDSRTQRPVTWMVLAILIVTTLRMTTLKIPVTWLVLTTLRVAAQLRTLF